MCQRPAAANVPVVRITVWESTRGIGSSKSMPFGSAQAPGDEEPQLSNGLSASSSAPSFVSISGQTRKNASPGRGRDPGTESGTGCVSDQYEITEEIEEVEHTQEAHFEKSQEIFGEKV